MTHVLLVLIIAILLFPSFRHWQWNRLRSANLRLVRKYDLPMISRIEIECGVLTLTRREIRQAKKTFKRKINPYHGDISAGLVTFILCIIGGIVFTAWNAWAG